MKAQLQMHIAFPDSHCTIRLFIAFDTGPQKTQPPLAVTVTECAEESSYDYISVHTTIYTHSTNDTHLGY